MLTFVTGLPGHSKTLYTIAALRKEYDGRDIYYHGIAELKLPWIPLDNPEQWYQCPDGAVIIIDEAQRIFPVRDPRRAAPEKCSRFETHRHQGLDIVLITQSPKLVDHHVRNLCGRHIHVVRARTGNNLSMIYTSGKLFRPEDRRELNLCEKKPFAYPKDAFSLYKSAEVHTVKTHYPAKLLLFPLLLLTLAGLIYTFISKVSNPSTLRLASQELAEDAVAETSNINGAALADQIVDSLDAYLQQQLPRIDSIPHSAPKYDELTAPRSYPRPAACIESARLGCRCYTQQATPFAIGADQCRDIVAHGYFDEARSDPATWAQSASWLQASRWQ